MENNKSKIKNYVFGGIAGALVGIVATFLIHRAADLNEEDWETTRKKITKVGLKTISLLWSLIENRKTIATN